ncbi:hypothetical protein FIBSPDRAFT_953769 [Athelia psychrophila]|uniref:Uncharacterized protein n=1 Tax=Athelia psychrophila TaxID=1759441 RepID=A0A166JVU7_9AGAM|nr:hypothetical protein FIBSPDRAFT_953769 [Fibularhizoctonia sp. CBS 109695]
MPPLGGTWTGLTGIKAFSASPGMLGRGHHSLESSGLVWSVPASDFISSQIAMGCTDGTFITTYSRRNPGRNGTVPWLIHRIYQIDYNRISGELCMLDKFMPTVIISFQAHPYNFSDQSYTLWEKVKKPTTEATSKAKSPTPVNPIAIATSVWPPVVCVHRIVCDSGKGFSGAPLLAGATATGGQPTGAVDEG